MNKVINNNKTPRNITNEYSNFNKRKIATFYYFLAQKIDNNKTPRNSNP